MKVNLVKSLGEFCGLDRCVHMPIAFQGANMQTVPKITRVPRHSVLAVLMILALMLGNSSVAQEENSDLAATKRIPGTDHPDLNGIWQALNTANYNVERHLAAPALMTVEGPRGPVPHFRVLAMGAVGSVPGGLGVIKEGKRIPYTPEAAKIREENRANWADRDPEVKCFLPGVPRANYMPFPFQIVQSDSSFFIAYEYAGAVRDIFYEDPGPAPVDSWMGQSVGKWNDDTLEVRVTAQLASTWFDRSGNHHSEKMVVTEKWTPMGPNHIKYQATIDDPETFTEPWTIEMPLYRRMEENLILMDFKCVQFVEELLYGQWRRESVQPEE